MKKLFRILIALSITVLFLSCGQKATTYEAKEALSKHLVERYGEEFEIGYMGKRSDGKEVWYEAEIYPSKYVGTPKERDKYYHRRGTVNIKKGILGDRLGFVGDTYGKVKINESAEEFYEKKLKELFGNNVLQVYDIKFNRILKDYSFENIIKIWKEEGVRLTIIGGIYIFGRVENDEDREWYRKQIYEFIQFMKETGTFEYVDLGINVIDERSLTEYFEKNKWKILEAKQKYKTSSEFIAYRDKIFKEAEKEFKQMSQEDKKRKINSYLKFNFTSENMIKNKDNGYSVIYHTGLVSSKFIDSEPRARDIKKREYNKIDDVNLLNTMKILYDEYIIREDKEIVEI
ncbi:hypothetical protein [uncultured Fusobacterium sp.]|uniref:hypothetical protein n=1 Tax=uncultured Fusobacterium sp. TaxID=159267 RepID=UPI0027DAE693|nr:hypothetical protein [uncultured Fusobacterium sp.]